MTPHPLTKEGEHMNREERIEEEVERLNDIFEDVTPEKKKVAQGIIEEVAFMRITLQDLKEEINENGTIDIMPQGEYSIRRQSPEVQTYNTMIQRYNTAYKELFNLLPKEVVSDIDDEFNKF